MNPIIQLDEKWFRAINSGLAASWLDPIMLFFSGHLIWVVIIGFLVLVTWKYPWRVKIPIFLLAGSALIFTDYVCFSLIKLKYLRLRPCLVFAVRLVADSCGNAYSFPSNHAANGMVLATVFSYFIPWKYSVAVFGTVLLISFSRIYVGVHFPSDVLGGILIGALFGRIITRLTLSIFHSLRLNGSQEVP